MASVKESALFARVAPDSDDDEDTEEKINEYTVVRRLGEGAFAEVKLAKKAEDPFAIKVFSKRALQKKKEFVRVGRRMKCTTALDKARKELALMKKVGHRHVVRCFEIIDDTDGDGLYLVLEFASLGQVMDWDADKMMYVSRDGGVLSEDTSRTYFRNMVLGLDYLHRHNIVHRDIKPENVLVKDGHEATLADLGVAHFFDDDAPDDRLAKTEGTPPFFAPECCAAAGGPFSTTKVDLWAMGCTLFAFLSGHLPYFHTSAATLSTMIASEPVDFSKLPPGLSASCTNLLHRLLDRDPDRRISLADVMTHPWVTLCGTCPLQQLEDSAADGALPVSAQELATAVTPLTTMNNLVALKLRMRRHIARRRMQRAIVLGPSSAPAIGGVPAAAPRPLLSTSSSSSTSRPASHRQSRRASLHHVVSDHHPPPPPPPPTGNIAKPTPTPTPTPTAMGATHTRQAPASVRPPPLPPQLAGGSGASQDTATALRPSQSVTIPPARRRSFSTGRSTSSSHTSPRRRRGTIAALCSRSAVGFARGVSEAGRRLLTAALKGGTTGSVGPTAFGSSPPARVNGPSSPPPPVSHGLSLSQLFDPAHSAEKDVLASIGSKLVASSIIGIAPMPVASSTTRAAHPLTQPPPPPPSPPPPPPPPLPATGSTTRTATQRSSVPGPPPRAPTPK